MSATDSGWNELKKGLVKPLERAMALFRGFQLKKEKRMSKLTEIESIGEVYAAKLEEAGISLARESSESML